MRKIIIDSIPEVGVGLNGLPWASPTRLEAFGELVRVDPELAERLLRARPGSCRVRVRHRAAEPLERLGYQVELEEEGGWHASALVEGRVIGYGWGETPTEAIRTLAGELGVEL